MEYEVVEREAGVERRLGRVTMDGDGLLAVSVTGGDAGAADDGALERLVQRMNAKSVLHVDVPAPEGAPKFAKASRVVRRGEAAFVPALRDQLLTYYDIELVAA